MGKVTMPILTVIFSAFALVGILMFTEKLTYRSFELTSCTKKRAVVNTAVTYSRDVDGDSINYAADDRFVFDAKECTLVNGNWIFNRSIQPLYSDTTCPYLDRQVTCSKNGRLDSDYLHWEWQPDDCILPRFDPKKALQSLQGKRLMFVGDSLQRGQWQSFVCLVEAVIPPAQKSMKRGRARSTFKAKEYNATIEFYWAPFLVESNTDVPIITDAEKRIMRVDTVAKHAKHWLGADILVFNTYVWWMTGRKIKSLWGSFANGEDGYQELEAAVSYTLALKTWANWVDSNVNPNTTRVFFTTMSPTHQRSADWGNAGGVKCFNETKPVTRKRYWGSGSDKRMMTVVAGIIGKMKVPVTLINITQLSEYRIDAHTSVYTELGGKLLSEKDRADPLHYADCIHWCLPGVPDTWNRILYAHLL